MNRRMRRASEHHRSVEGRRFGTKKLTTARLKNARCPKGCFGNRVKSLPVTKV